MSRVFRTFFRLRETAPVLSLLAALLLPTLLPHHGLTAYPNEGELAVIAAAVDSAPHRVGSWIGRDVPVHEAARQLLRPNAILSRQYVHLNSGLRLDFTLVHCADSRDMLGHYPPICYPSNGWVPSSRVDGATANEHNTATALQYGQHTLPVQVYGYSRVRSFATGEEAHIRIFNFFILPDGTVTHDVKDVGLRANWLGARISGVTQIQILTESAVPLDRAVHAASELLEGLTVLFDALGVKRSGPVDTAKDRSRTP